jgi:2-keto-3-deoxy-L-rhamnonate aldolase RhmA
MNGLEFRKALKSDRRVYGTMIVSTSPRWPQNIGQVGLDFVFIDTEHIAIDRAQLSWMCQCYDALGITPVVRIPSPDPFEACKALDGGAKGIIAPYIERPEQVADLVGAVKFRPLKGSRLTDALAVSGNERVERLGDELSPYLDDRNTDRSFIANIESLPAVAALEGICAVEGLDAILIGPHDLSCSMGIPEQWGNPAFVAMVTRIIETARAAGVGAGIHYTVTQRGSAQEIEWIRRGANLIVHGADIITFVNCMRADLEEIRAAVGDADSGSEKNINI